MKLYKKQVSLIWSCQGLSLVLPQSPIVDRVDKQTGRFQGSNSQTYQALLGIMMIIQRKSEFLKWVTKQPSSLLFFFYHCCRVVLLVWRDQSHLQSQWQPSFVVRKEPSASQGRLPTSEKDIRVGKQDDDILTTEFCDPGLCFLTWRAGVKVPSTSKRTRVSGCCLSLKGAIWTMMSEKRDLWWKKKKRRVYVFQRFPTQIISKNLSGVWQ